jgi:8-oxo-(d)GTP phosphatase
VAAVVTSRLVLAAGGVVWRRPASGEPEILVVHRPKYDDWSLPKGKLDVGEHRLAAAVREVYEETGARGAPQVRLRTVNYLTGEPGVEKSVEFWSMRLLADEGHDPDAEVDVRQWIPLSTARERLTYAHDRGVVARFETLPPGSTVVLVRHAWAGSRERWTGPDDERPLDAVGREDAHNAAPLLALFAPERFICAPALRCRATVAPAAELVGIPIEVDGRFAENGDPDEALQALRAIAASGPAAVVCSQGGLMRPLLGKIRSAGGEPATPKGAAWVLTFSETGDVVATDALDLRAPAV